MEKKDRIINRVKSKIAEIETAEIEECLYNVYFPLSMLILNPACFLDFVKKKNTLPIYYALPVY